MRRLWPLLAIALIASLTIAPQAVAKKRKLTPPPANFFGVDSVHEPGGGEFGLMAQSGVEIFRMPIHWQTVEPDPPVEFLGNTFRSYDFSEPDRMMRRAAQTGVEVHAGLNTTPGWVAGDPRFSPMRSPEGRAGWKAFSTAVVERYGRGGEFWRENTDLPVRPPLSYQIWNEQNAVGQYRPAANPEEYGRLIRSAGEEIRRAEPGATIVTGGMFATPQSEGSIDAWTYMSRLLAQPGARRYIDAVAIHPYSPDLRGIKYQFDKMRKVLSRSGLPEMPIQVTEIGWSSGRSDKFYFFKGRKGQAKLLNKSFKLMLRKREKWNLERVFWFTWRDVGQGFDCAFCRKFGLLETDLTPKPSYHRYTKYSLMEGR